DGDRGKVQVTRIDLQARAARADELARAAQEAEVLQEPAALVDEPRVDGRGAVDLARPLAEQVPVAAGGTQIDRGRDHRRLDHVWRPVTVRLDQVGRDAGDVRSRHRGATQEVEFATAAGRRDSRQDVLAGSRDVRLELVA